MSVSAPRGGLRFEDRGSGIPLVLLHGLTFDRTSWAPVIERLGTAVRTIAIDLPGHGETGGPPCSVWEAAGHIHALTSELELGSPLVVGHSISGAIASIYGASYPTLGVVNIDQYPDIRPFAQLLRSLGPALRGRGFQRAFEAFQESMEIDRVPEPFRSVILRSQQVRPEVVLGYWDEVMHDDPERLQARIDEAMRETACPYLAVFGHPLTPAEREYVTTRVDGLQITEWSGSGHFVHLADPDRFTTRLRSFIDFCAGLPSRPSDDRDD
jgi:pimeloyl-ACP methyl ester carboxylesterase